MAAWLGQAQAANLYSDKYRRSIPPGRHAIRFHFPPVPCGTFGWFSPISHSLRSVVPLGSFFGGCPPPPVTRLCRPTFVVRHRFPSAGPSQRVLPVFIRALRKTFRSFLASLSASATGVLATTNRSVFALFQRVTTLEAVPSLVSKTVTFATGRVIPKTFFLVKVFCVLFSKNDLFFLFMSRTLNNS
jgi:hypothetical protein